MPKSITDIREICLKYEIPVEQIKTFWEELEDGRLVTSKCSDCDNVMFPPQSYCQNCLSKDIKWIGLEGEAVVKGFTHICVLPTTFSGEEPYTIVVAEFKKHPGVRAFAWLEGIDKEDVEVGMDVKLTPKQREEGPPYYVYKPV
ncbi:OB-fold domain and Zn-ribbon containing protein putative acyl-CoA-binding protein [Methanonatronarchaeum thermophilum]|uniref:OB-fold domain and Zn-ribbon containing protein putative acyl-CoA-binding protein n=1 Tax=Methanonatronarchaeum thermophilum TaxID=1927129 RepID=A0A1Y3GAE9_9EURY|nr:Zn-ribbon domain-containing OB-fold protein [Methanonatronarchaeum thermophilum]OUJ18237.1 OB-fold domain and Zn-ribbon containing protein putative acyl-CoA-binding protein [Methanonatronarchaeum thermophilum]